MKILIINNTKSKFKHINILIMKTKSQIIALIICLFCQFTTIKAQNSNSNQSKIQVALLLDTSNSMDGLIEQAKSQLWSVVNELATARYAGFRPTLEIALYEYGNDGLSSSDGYIRKVSDLTTDLDKISESLFALKTNGGSEFCGQVINNATIQLSWSNSNSDLKMIFIAGNEEFTQGSFLYTNACKEAITHGIVVNTIFCGDKNEGINGKWKDGADLADGKYMNIDQNQVVADIATPFDDEILKLNSSLNSTYIGYGSSGKQNKMRQAEQDNNAYGQSSTVSVSRAVSKSSGAYQNSSWDLVDAVKDDKKALEKVDREDLPDEMKNMNNEEMTKYLEQKQKEREEIQQKIVTLNKKRETFVSEKRREDANNQSLGNALIQTVHEQAEVKNYKFEK
jgi:hypothetical protein